MVQTFSIDDVSKHNTLNDAWVIIHNKVYNITDFMTEHPGGEEVLIEEAGRDATESFEDIGHSDDARDLLNKFYVGELDEQSLQRIAMRKNPRALEPVPPPPRKRKCVFRILVPAAIIIGIFVYKFAAHSKR